MQPSWIALNRKGDYIAGAESAEDLRAEVLAYVEANVEVDSALEVGQAYDVYHCTRRGSTVREPKRTVRFVHDDGEPTVRRKPRTIAE